MDSKLHIISLDIDHINFKESLERIGQWGLARERGFVCFANVHMTIEAYQDPAFQTELQKARLILADGKPLALACQWLYQKKQERVAGMDFMPAILRLADKEQAKIFLYGSTEDVLIKLADKIRTDYPGVVLAGTISPPFRNLEELELAEHLEKINQSGANFVLVALGCPKQEKWMAANFQSVRGILLGVGGAFPVVAGIQKRAPRWMQRIGFEWFYRLIQEPGRLFRRYLTTNSAFAYLLLRQLSKKKES